MLTCHIFMPFLGFHMSVIFFFGQGSEGEARRDVIGPFWPWILDFIGVGILF